MLIETSPKHFAPIVPPRNLQNQINNTLEALKPSVGTKLEGLLLNSDSDSDFDPRADESETNSSSTTTSSINGNGIKISNDFFGFEPPKTMGQHLFTNPVNHTNGVNGTMNGHQVSPPPLCKLNGNHFMHRNLILKYSSGSTTKSFDSTTKHSITNQQQQ